MDRKTLNTEPPSAGLGFHAEDLQVVEAIARAIIAGIGPDFDIASDNDAWALTQGLASSRVAWHLRDPAAAARRALAIDAYVEALSSSSGPRSAGGLVCSQLAGYEQLLDELATERLTGSENVARHLCGKSTLDLRATGQLVAELLVDAGLLARTAHPDVWTLPHDKDRWR